MCYNVSNTERCFCNNFVFINSKINAHKNNTLKSIMHKKQDKHELFCHQLRLNIGMFADLLTFSINLCSCFRGNIYFQ